jgi:outer membrane protein assembly factor BamB
VTSTVLYDRNMLYIGTDESDGSLHAHELARGRERWKQRIGAVSATPLLDGDVVYAGTGAGTVAALHTEDGRRIWRVGLHGAVTETFVDNGTYIVAFTAADSVFALRKSDGGMVARAGLPGSAAAAPALSGNTIVVPVHPTGVIGLDATSLLQSWRVETSAPVLTAPAVTQDGVVYVAARDGSVYRITDGRAERIVQVPHALSGSLTLARDHLLLGSYDGTLLAVSLDGNVVWTHRFDDSIVAPVAVGDQSVYVPFLNGRIVKLR